jgi:hypothetical protein
MDMLLVFLKQLLWENGNYQVKAKHIILDIGLGSNYNHESENKH